MKGLILLIVFQMGALLAQSPVANLPKLQDQETAPSYDPNSLPLLVPEQQEEGKKNQEPELIFPLPAEELSLPSQSFGELSPPALVGAENDRASISSDGKLILELDEQELEASPTIAVEGGLEVPLIVLSEINKLCKKHNLDTTTCRQFVLDGCKKFARNIEQQDNATLFRGLPQTQSPAFGQPDVTGMNQSNHIYAQPQVHVEQGCCHSRRVWTNVIIQHHIVQLPRYEYFLPRSQQGVMIFQYLLNRPQDGFSFIVYPDRIEFTGPKARCVDELIVQEFRNPRVFNRASMRRINKFIEQLDFVLAQ